MEQQFFEDVSPIHNVDFPARHVDLLVCFCLQTRIHPSDSKFIWPQTCRPVEAENGGPPGKGDASGFGNHRIRAVSFSFGRLLSC